MRKIENELLHHVVYWDEFKGQNTKFLISKNDSTYGGVFLFGNLISVFKCQPISYAGLDITMVMYQTAGFPTATTHSRLRTLGVTIENVAVGQYEYSSWEHPFAVQGRNLDYFYDYWDNRIELKLLFPGIKWTTHR